MSLECEKVLRSAGFKSRADLEMATRMIFSMAGVFRPTWRSRLFGRESVRVFISGDRLLLGERRDFRGVLAQ